MYATDQNQVRQGLLAQVPVTSEKSEVLVISDLHIPSASVGEGSKVLVIGVESDVGGSGMESTLDYAWATPLDWATPVGSITSVNQSTDKNADPLVVSTLVQVSAVVQTNADVCERVKGVRLYLTFAKLDHNNATVREQISLVGTLLLSEMVHRATGEYFGEFDVGGLALSGQSTSEGWYEWSVVLFNDAFESVATHLGVEDAAGLMNGVVVAVTTTSVAAVASAVAVSVFPSIPASIGTVTTLSTTGTAQVASGSSSIGLPNASPILLIGNLQSIAMTGSLQLSGMPANYRSFARSFAWTNLHFRTQFWHKPSNEISGPTAAHFSNLGHKSLKANQIAVTSYESVATNGSVASEALRNGVMVFVLLAVVCPTLYAIVTSHEEHSTSYEMEARHKKRRMLMKRLMMGMLTVAYYGLSVVSLIVLWSPNPAVNDRALAMLVVLFIAVPLPFLSVVLYTPARQPVACDPDPSKSPKSHRISVSTSSSSLSKTSSTSSLLQSVSATRQGCEWYSVLVIYRRLCCAIAIGILHDVPEIQCAFVMATFFVCLVANVWKKPLQGGYSSLDFFVELTGQLLTIFSCGTTLTLSRSPSSNSVSGGLGFFLIFAQVMALLGMLGVSFVSMFRYLVARATTKEEKTEGRLEAYCDSPRIKKRSPYSADGTLSAPSSPTSDSSDDWRHSGDGKVIAVTIPQKTKHVRDWLAEPRDS